MAIKSVKSIAEYAIRKWMTQHDFSDGYFTLTMNGCDGTITDRAGDKLRVMYDPVTRQVEIEE